MSELFNVSLVVEVHDPDVLLEAAVQKVLVDDDELTEPEVRASLSNENGDADVKACLEVVFDPDDASPPGTVVQECTAE